ncbi:MAG TPA: galactokinase [Pyrinomonadaceae bacterium]|jgi:galactokinase
MVEAGKLKEKFRSLYGALDFSVYRAPGRVNLIGEHTDYNLGFVMPAAIDFYTWVAIAPRADLKISIHSENFAETMEFDLDEAMPEARGHWSDYPRGIAVILEQAGYNLRGANLLVRGEVPIGAGLSSSAAIEVATGYALLDMSGATIDRMELAKLCQRAENEFVGMRCGLMDQFISCFGERGRALMLDCRSLEYSRLPLPLDVRLVIANTMVKHELASSEYNARRAECEEGVRLLSLSLPHVYSLRDVTLAELEEHSGELPTVIYKRCHHVVSENERVVEAKGALERVDLTAFGRLMAESHQSLRDDYEVSCTELDVMVELANETEGVYGARMTGGGFGGCTINLVRADGVASFQEKVAAGYEKSTGLKPEIYVCSAAQGVERLTEE